MGNVLLVIQDAAIREAIAEQEDLLDGVTFRVAADAAAAHAAVAEAPPAAVVVDDRLPDESGTSLCHSLRTAGMTAFMVLLGADGQTAHMCGADAALPWPLRLGVLIPMVLEAVNGGPEAEAFPVGGMTFRPEARRLETVEGDIIHVTEKEAAILACLNEAEGAVVMRETLLDRVWGYAPELDTHTLETHIYRLRQKVEPDAATPSILVTEEGGYRLIPG